MGTILPLFLLYANEYYTRNLLLLLNTNTNTNTISSFATNTYLIKYPSLNTYNVLSYINKPFAFINRTRYMSICRSHLSSILYPYPLEGQGSVASVASVATQQRYLTYSTTGHNSKTAISPLFITGYSDAEGCFNVGFQRNPNGKFYVRPLFQIQVHSKDSLLLMQIKNYLGGIGNIHIKGNKSIFAIRSLDDILKIISHFDNYPLITQKRADFLLSPPGLCL